MELKMPKSRVYVLLDEQNRVYIIFTLEEIMESLNCANQKATRLMVELEKKILLQAKENELQTVLQHKTDAVKAALEGYGKLFEKINGRKMNAAEITSMTEMLGRTYDNAGSWSSAKKSERYGVLGTEFDDFQNKMFAPENLGLIQRGSTLGLYEEFAKAIDKGRELKAVVDGLYGTESPSGGTTIVTTTTGGYTPDPEGGNVGNTGTTWSLSSDSDHQKQLLTLKKKYLDGGYKTEQEYNAAVLQLEIDTLKRRLANTTLSAAERLSAEQSLNDKLIEQKKQTSRKAEDLEKQGLKVIQEVNADKIAEENARYEQERAKFEGNASVLEAVERKHKARLSKIHLDALDKRIKDSKAAYDLELLTAKNRQAEEVRTFTGSASEKEAMQRRHTEELAQISLKYAQDLQSILASVQGIDGNIDVKFNGLSQAELNALKQKLQEIIALKRETETSDNPNTGTEQDGGKKYASGGSALGLSSEDWNALLSNAEAGIDAMDRFQLAVKAVGSAANEALQLVSMASERQAAIERQQLKEFKKSQDQRKTALEKRVNAGLMTEAQYNAEVEAMDSEYDAKQEELQLKQAKRQKQMQLIQAIINTALGITAALATVPPASYVMAALNAAMGAAQIALIASTPITTGAEEGGEQFVARKQDGKRFKARLSPDKRGFIGQPTLLVGENGPEYVIPNDGIENPTLAPLLGTIEQARRAGTLKSLNFNAVYPTPAIGRASGGYTVAPSAGTTDTSFQNISSGGADKELKQLLARLNERLEKPIRASVSMLGRDGIVENISRYQELKNRGRLK